MGCSLIGSSSGNYAPPNPNPRWFEVISREIYGRFTLLEVHYPGCTNFEGSKLLVLKGEIPDFPLRKRCSYGEYTLDPHFFKNGPVVARFIPTSEGIAMARLFCWALTSAEHPI